MPKPSRLDVNDDDLIAAARKSEHRGAPVSPVTGAAVTPVEPAPAGSVDSTTVATDVVPTVDAPAPAKSKRGRPPKATAAPPPRGVAATSIAAIPDAAVLALAESGVTTEPSDFDERGNIAGELAPHIVKMDPDRDFSEPTIDLVADSLAAMGVMDDGNYIRRGPSLDQWTHRDVANAAAQADVARTEVESESLARSAAMIGRMAQTTPVVDADRPSRSPVTVDPLTQRVNAYGLDYGRTFAPYYREHAIFDYLKDRNGFRHKFSRWYPAQRLLVDFFARPSSAVDAEVSDKIRQLVAFNAAVPDVDRFGYVCAFAGDVISDNSIVAALHGEVFALPLRVPTNAPW